MYNCFVPTFSVMFSPCHILFLVVLVTSSAALTIKNNNEDLSVFSPDVQSGFTNEDGSDIGGGGGGSSNSDFLSFDSNYINNDDAFLSDKSLLSNLNEEENIFTYLTTIATDGCSLLPQFLSLSQKLRIRIRQPSEGQSYTNSNSPSNNNPFQNPTSEQEALKKSQQEHWCSSTAVSGFGNIPVCEENPRYHQIPSEAHANAHAEPPFPDLSGFVTLLQCTPLGLRGGAGGGEGPVGALGTGAGPGLGTEWWEAILQQEQPCPSNNVYCCNAWLPSPPAQDGWGYWCWPSDRSARYSGAPPDWSEILRSFEIP